MFVVEIAASYSLVVAANSELGSAVSVMFLPASISSGVASTVRQSLLYFASFN